MFTGLVKEVGKVLTVQPNAEGKEIVVESKVLINLMGIDDSVSINGACQTVTSIEGHRFKFQSVHVTLEKTNLGDLKPGDQVNMELAMRPMDFLGGHIVQGHVNAQAECVKVDSRGNNYECTYKIHEDQMKYIVKEGSVTLNGISLTVADVDRDNNSFSVSIIPHTWKNTTLGNYGPGKCVNVEVDILAKYLENLIYYKEKHKTASKITAEWIKEQGY